MSTGVEIYHESNGIAEMPHPSAPHKPKPQFSLGDLQTMSELVAKSGLFPGITTPQAACTLMLLSQADGIHPMHAMKRYHIIEGRPSMRADAMQAEFQSRGGSVKWLEFSDERAAAVFSHRVHCPDGVTVETTYEEFKSTGLTGGKYGEKDNWKKHRGAMLRARCISRGVRMVDPGTIVGMYTPEEVADFAPGQFDPELVIEPSEKQVRAALDNNTGHGHGKYVPREDEDRYTRARDKFLGEVNERWADLWQKRSGWPFDGIKSEVMNSFQLNAHLVKWAAETGLLDGELASVATSPDEKRRFAAVVYTQHKAETRAEMGRYALDTIAKAELAYYRKHPELAEDHAFELPQAESTAEDESQEDSRSREPGEEG